MRYLSVFIFSAAIAVAQGQPDSQPGERAVIAGQLNVFSFGNRLEGQSGPVQGRPFSGTEVRHTLQTLADGTHVEHTDTTQLYRDAQGRMRAESPNRIFIYDPVGGFTADLFPSEQHYEKLPLKEGTSVFFGLAGSREDVSRTSASTPPHYGQRAARPGTEDLGTQFLGGIQVKHSRYTSVIPAGTFGNDRPISVTNERWYSDDLQLLVKSVNNDPRFGVSTYELANIVQAPPDPTLFQIPIDYSEQRRH